MSASTINQLYWKRVGFVKIEDSNGKMIAYGGSARDGLDFKFDVKMQPTYVEFNVGILGLSRDTINDLITWKGRFADNPAKGRNIEVYAGYYDESDKQNKGANLIAHGQIWEAFPSAPPEMWLNCVATRALKLHTQVTGVEPMKKKPLTEIASKIASLLKLNYTSRNWKSKNVSGDREGHFYFEGKRYDQLLNAFGSKFGVVAVEQLNGQLIVCDKKLEYQDPEGSPPKLNLNTGLLSLGGVSVNGAKAKMRLNAALNVRDWVYVESQLIPQANGTYFVSSLHHTGQYRGDPWFTEIDLIKKVTANNAR